MDFRMVLHEVARTIRSEGFLVGNSCERQLAAELVSEMIEIGVGEDRRCRAGLHVSDAAAIDLAVHDLPAPGIARPAGAVVGYREHVDMAIEYEMAPRVRAIEAAD